MTYMNPLGFGTMGPGQRGGQGMEVPYLGDTIQRIFTNRSGNVLAVGDVLMVDVLCADGASVTFDNAVDSEGLGTGGLSNVLDPTAVAVLGQAPLIVAIAEEVLANDAKGVFTIYGKTDALVIASSGSVAIGSQLIVTAGNNFDLVDVAGELYRAVGLEAMTTPTSATLGSVYVYNDFNLMAARGGAG